MNWTRLHKLIDDSFNEEELRTLCFSLKIDYDNLGGRGKSANARELIDLVRRTGQEADLHLVLAEIRPNMQWIENDLINGSIPDEVDGFYYVSANDTFVISDGYLIEQIDDIGTIAHPSIRVRFAKDLHSQIFYKYSMDCPGSVYTAWRNNDKVYLSMLPNTPWGDQKTYVFDVVKHDKLGLMFVGEWRPNPETQLWKAIDLEEFHQRLAGFIADRSGCFMPRESTIFILEQRGARFSFPVGPSNKVEKFCGWENVGEDEVVKSKTSDNWDRNPRVDFPGFDTNMAIYHSETGEGILLITVRGAWTTEARYFLKDSLNTYIPTRYHAKTFGVGNEVIFVHLLNATPALTINQGRRNQIREVDYAFCAHNLVFAALGRMVAFEKGIKIPDPSPDITLPKLDSEMQSHFVEAFISLINNYPPHILDYPREDGSDTWGKLWHAAFVGHFYQRKSFDWSKVVTPNELIDFIKMNEGGCGE